MIKPKTAIIAASSAFALCAIGVGAYTSLKRQQRLREDIRYQLVERVHERLANAEKQLFQAHTRHKTRQNLHAAIIHTDGWEYFCDAEAMLTKLHISQEMLNTFMSADPKGKLAYMECRDILKECEELIEESLPEVTALDAFADEVKRIFRHKPKRTFDERMQEYSERLDEDWYKLDKQTEETILRPIYPWWGFWLPKSAAKREVKNMLKERPLLVRDAEDAIEETNDIPDSVDEV